MDGEGNRTAETVGGVSTSFTYDNDDELNSTSGGFANSYGYDSDGEQTSRTVGGVASTLGYDYEGQLVSVTTGGSTTSFTYDAAGRRVSRTAGGVTTSFLYDGARVLLEKQGSTTSATYSYGNTLTRKDGEFPLFDGHGSERTVTNSSQSVTGTLNLDAFGVQAGSTGSSTDPYEYAATSGYRSDGDAGLMLVGARYYDAQVGRFISRDTVLTQKPYCYCEGDSVNSLDPSGHYQNVINGGSGISGTIGQGVGSVLQQFGQGCVVVGIAVGVVALGVGVGAVLLASGGVILPIVASGVIEVAVAGAFAGGITAASGVVVGSAGTYLNKAFGGPGDTLE